MTREDFLKEFLGALGAVDCIFTEMSENYIYGTAIFNPNDPNENQDFCWHRANSSLPTIETHKLAILIKEQRLLSIDRIVVGRDELMKLYDERWCMHLSLREFENILDELESVEVAMVDDGKENDVFFIHE